VIFARLSLSFSLETTHSKAISGIDSIPSEIATISMIEPGEGMNLAIFNAQGLLLNKNEREVLRRSYQPQELCKCQMLYDQLVYPLIFWTGLTASGILESDKLQGSRTPIRKVLVSLILQSPDHFIYQVTTLREEFAWTASRGFVNSNIKFRQQAQRRCLAREDDILRQHFRGNSTGISPSNGHSSVSH
jgi:hypothetical protein